MMQTKTEAFDRKLSAGNILIPLLAVVAYLMIQLVVLVLGMFSKILESVGSGMDPDDAFSRTLMQGETGKVLLFSALLHILAFSLILFFSRRRGTPYVFRRMPQKQALFLLPVFALGALGLSSLWMLACQGLASVSPFFRQAIETYENLIQTLRPPEQGEWWIHVLAVGVLVPIAEELLFRGVLISEWKLCMPRSLAVLLSSLLFSVFHGNWVQSGYTFFVGLLLGTLYLWTESIVYPIILHMIFNLIGGSLSDVLMRMGEDGAIWMLVFNLVELVFFLFAVGGLVYLYQHRRSARTIARGSLTDLQSLSQPQTGAVPGAEECSSKVG